MFVCVRVRPWLIDLGAVRRKSDRNGLSQTLGQPFTQSSDGH